MNTAPESFFRRLAARLANARFFTFSALLHVAIVIMGGGVVLFRDMAEPPDFVADTGSIIASDPAANMPPHSQLQPLEIESLPPAQPTVSAPSLSAIAVSAPATSSILNPASVSALTRGHLADAARKAEKIGMAASTGGAMAQGGTAMQIFQVMANANSVVVVVDVSGSMISGRKSTETYGVLEREIGKLIKQLSEKNTFGIVAFSRDAEPYKAGLTQATREERERAYNWLKRISPEVTKDPRASAEAKAFHHGTRADLGLQRAFAMQPDAIFFVSDGEPSGVRPAQILEQVAAAQASRPRRATVHAIAYLADSGQQFMRDLAQQNGGNFREVNPKDMR